MTEKQPPQKGRSIWITTTLLAIAFCWGIVAIFQARYASGDLYPAFSTMRADPKGLRILYESCKKLDTLDTSRNNRKLELFNPDAYTTLVFAGFDSWSLKFISYEQRELIDNLTEGGHRVIIAVKPYEWLGASALSSNSIATAAGDIGIGKWNVQLDKKPFSNEQAFSEATFIDGILPEAADQSINLVSQTIFAVSNNAWKVVAKRDDWPVVIERKASDGIGSLVMCSDAYFMSNQGLFEEQPTDTLNWMLHQHSQVVFDETHLGTTASPGVAALLRRYNLEWFILSLALLASLYVWRHNRSLAPMPPHFIDYDELEGRDHLSGMVNLLSRSMSPVEALQEAGRRWKGSLKFKKVHDPDRIEEVKRVLENIPAYLAAKETPVQVYKKIQNITTRRNG